MIPSHIETVELLHTSGASCVIENNGDRTVCNRRGVKDLFDLLTSSPETLAGAFIADKVIGKGAAALMVLGGAEEVYADLLSEPALRLLTASGVFATYRTLVPNIINRTKTGICPVESLCKDCKTAEECMPLIEQFIRSLPEQ